MHERKLPSEEIKKLGAEIQRAMGVQKFSYEKPKPEFMIEALLYWLDEYTRPKQESLLPDIHLDDEK